MIQVKFKQWTCNVNFAKYVNGRPAIMLSDIEDGSPVAKATINIPEIELDNNEVIIKDYSENEGVLDVLLNAGIIEDTGTSVVLNNGIVPICKILTKKSLTKNENR